MADLWVPVAIPPFQCERVEGISVPRGTRVLVAGYDEMFVVDLAEPASVRRDPDGDGYDEFDGTANRCRYGGEAWQLLGLHGGEPLLISPAGEWLELDEVARTVSVFVGTDEVWSAPYKNFSGDWAAATFSPDGQFIVLGTPYDFDLRAWRRAAPAQAEGR